MRKIKPQAGTLWVAQHHLSDTDKRAYTLADNKLAENAGWDANLLASELQALLDVNYDLSVTGFQIAEIDRIIDLQSAMDGADTVDLVTEPGEGQTICRSGDFWQLGPHRLLCGDARKSDDIARLTNGAEIDLIFTDPPYNVAVDGHVCGSGKIKHAEFAFASGEMSATEFTSFLTETLTNAAGVCRDGAIAFVCMDWRHMREMLDAGQAAFTELKNLCVWNKTNGGMGTFYRSKHELIFVFKAGRAPHTNGFGLGETGRYRTNVWDYAGVNTLGAQAKDALAMHPTVKPVAMVADAIKDCTHRRGKVLDVFAGSGSTLIATHECGRIAYALEYEPKYCDVILNRFRDTTGIEPVHHDSGMPLSELAQIKTGAR